MTMRATLQENTASGVDELNQPVPPSWSDLPVPVPCRVWSSSRQEIVDGDKQVTVETITGLFPFSSAISEANRIGQVADRRGVVLFGGPLQVQTVQRRDDFLQVGLRRVA